MKKMLTLCFAVVWMFAFTACGKEEAAPVSEDAPQEATTDMSLETFESSFGYTMAYDPCLFYVLTDASSDNFELIDEDLDTTPPVYVAVQRVSGYTVAEYTKILENKSTTGAYSETDTAFGADERNAVTVTYEEQTDLGLAYYTETIVKVGSDLLYIEVVTYEGMDADINMAINKMLETFSVEK